MSALQALAKTVVPVRTCLGLTLAVAHLITILEHFTEEGTVLICSSAVLITHV